MKRLTKRCFTAGVLVAMLLSVASWSFAQEEDARTLSPYFFVQSDDPATDRMPLKATEASVSIAGVIADVRVTQVYKNEGRRPIEAVYVFPGSTRAAVYGMKMTIGKRVIEAQINRRDEARKIYEQARDAGKSASLLEQHRPNVFQMNVANILPGDEIRVELKYTELLIPTDRIYEFVYPTVVGPRYAGRGGPGKETSDWTANPYLKQGEASPATFDLALSLAAGMPVGEVSCPSHKVTTTFASADRVSIRLDKKDGGGANRDFILRYRLAGDRIAGGLLLHEGQKENFFALIVQPPQKIAIADLPGREYIFIVDVSGSMHGFPLDISKKLLADLIGNLRPSDTFNVLLFSGGSTLLAEESLPATRGNIQKAISVIERQRGGGGTELLPALQRALDLPRLEGSSRTMVMVTDGYVSVEEEAFDLIRANLGKANLFAFGIGSSVNRHLIEGMARVGMGEPFVLTDPKTAAAEAARFRKMIDRPVLAQIEVRFDGFETYDVEPQAVPDVLAERPVIVFGKWRGKPQGTITLRGATGTGQYSESLAVSDFKPSKDAAALKYLWARHRIALLSDYNSLRHRAKRVEDITRLALSYNLLSAYTSFVAVDSEIRNVDGKPVLVKQPLPLPQGVSNHAVGDAAFGPMMAQTAKMQRHEAVGRPAQPISPERAFKGVSEDEARKIEVLSLTVSKGWSRDKALASVTRQVEDLASCLKGTANGTIFTVRLTINADGTVKTVFIESGNLKQATIRQCLIEKMKGWIFPAGAAKEGNITIRIKLRS